MSFSLVWARQTSLARSELLQLLLPVMFLNDMMMVSADSTMDKRYILRGMICFRHNHYVAYFYSLSRNFWMQLNDERVTEEGHWSNIVRQIEDFDAFPVLLFFEAASTLTKHRMDLQMNRPELGNMHYA
jgi:hypothetical protein